MLAYSGTKVLIKYTLVFFFTLATMFIHWNAIDKSNEKRSIIWEPDDNYHQLIKAKNLDSCYKDCLAINNLLKYDFSNFNETQRYEHDVYLHHTAIEYHYLKSKILQISNKYFNDWEKTHLFITKITSITLVISFIILIINLFNLNVGLIASIIILPYVTVKYGFHFSNSSDDLASIFSIFSIVALNDKKIQNYILSLALSTLALFSHPVGVAMIFFNFIFLISRDREILSKNKIIYFSLSLILIIFYFRLDLNYLLSEYKFLNLYNSINLSFSFFLQLIILNIKSGAYFIYDLFNLLNLLIIILINIILRKNLVKIFQKYKNLGPMLFASTFIIIISFIHYAPEAPLITRMQQLLTLSFLSLYSVLTYEFFMKVRKSKFKLILITPVLLIFTLHSMYNLNNLKLKIKSNVETLNLNLEVEEISKIKENLDNEKPVIFKKNNSDFSTFKTIYYKFLLEGFNEKNIIIDQLLSHNEKKKFLNKNFLLVIPSPVINNNLILKEDRPNCFNISTFYQCIRLGWYGLNRTRMSDLLVRNNDYLKITSGTNIKSIYLNINTFNNNLILESADKKKINFKTNNSFDWLKINYSEFDFSNITFLLSNKEFVKLNGIKFNNNDLSWPWNQDVNISHSGNKNLRNLEFNLKKMIGDYYCEDYKIIHDKSSFMIIDMECQK
jgi:hypothetical protein